MTKKDFELIASVLSRAWGSQSIGEDMRSEVINNFAKELPKTNPLFDPVRFKSACNGWSEEENRGCKVCGLLERTTQHNKINCIANNGYHTYKK